MRRCVLVFACALALPLCLIGQTETATLSGRVTDSSGAVIVGATVAVTNVDENTSLATRTNDAGIYVFPSLAPANYRLTVNANGFSELVMNNIELHVQSRVSENVFLQVGSSEQRIIVSAKGGTINTEDAAESTVIDHQFVENMPLNGRSFQSLLTLSPGVSQVPAVATTPGYSGELTVNGQRTEANYFTVDGVSVNTGTAASNYMVGAGFSGSVPGTTILGTTQGSVSVEALEEFRAATSTYSAEYGRTPGGQFSFSTRSGTNNIRGSVYEYFRNDALDANDWFNNHATPQVPREAERQNDFGGVLGGPVRIPGLYDGKDKTFFFFSYEGLRLVLPQGLAAEFVPDLALRQQAPPALRPFLNAFALPNGREDGLNDGLAVNNLAYSAPSSVDSVGIRIDQTVSDKLKLFGRFADTPSSGWTYSSPAFQSTQGITNRSVTAGLTSSITQSQVNELRFNFTDSISTLKTVSTSYGGATPLSIDSVPGPHGQPLAELGSALTFGLYYGGFPSFQLADTRNTQKQYNVVDTYSWSRGRHQLRVGADWRRVSTFAVPEINSINADFFSESSVLAGLADVAGNISSTVVPVEPVFHNYSFFVEDEWKATRRLSLSLGLRWDINPAPGNLNGPSPFTVDQISNLATTKLAPTGTPLWKTDWRGLGPRLGVAYQLNDSPRYASVVQGGFGVFYDTGNVSGYQGLNGIGFASEAFYFAVPFPLTSAQVTVPPPSVAPPYAAPIVAFDPKLRLPYTMQWSLGVEQGLGANQSLTVRYVGSGGRKLLTQFESFPGQAANSNFAVPTPLFLTQNRASSNYDALEVKFQRNLSHGLQVLASYTWSHSIDDASSNFQIYELLRASSDFDVRQNLQLAASYDLTHKFSNSLASAVLEHWGLDTRVSARSALPLDVIGSQSVDPTTGRYLYFHPDLVSGIPIYLFGSQYPGGKILNYNAFTAAPLGVDGDAGRNIARGFDAIQADIALRRDFPLESRVQLQFRVEAFNVFNHPSFGALYSDLFYGPQLFGYAYNTLNHTGGLSPLYGNGGPRSLQIALKLRF